MSHPTTITLQKSFFSEAEKTLVEFEGLTASTFLFSTGVHGLRLKNQVGEIVMLPFQGQQIWDARFYGRTLTMKSMFTEPNATQVYLNTYGGFAIHCGAVAMGVPEAGDNHPLHGELPNAPYKNVQLLLGQDEGGLYMAVTGQYQYTIAFSHNYMAQPLVKLYANSGKMPVSLTVTNLKKSPMELMYLAHINFRPVDNGQLVYSAECTPATVRVRSSIPSHVKPPAGYREFLQELAANPAMHNTLAPGLAFDPEVVFFIDYQTDADGWAHTLQLHPDGSADVISHKPAELDNGVRWICRTADQDALGLLLPATAETEGYSAEKGKGNLKTIPGGGQWSCHMELGALSPEDAAVMAAKINDILAG